MPKQHEGKVAAITGSAQTYRARTARAELRIRNEARVRYLGAIIVIENY
jgi:hypothetical protein